MIILNYFSREDTLRLYRQLSGYPDLKLLVVDNSCNPAEAASLRREIPAASLLITKKNLGYAGGNNLGIRYLTGMACPPGKTATAVADTDPANTTVAAPIADTPGGSDADTDRAGAAGPAESGSGGDPEDIDLIALLNPDITLHENLFPALRSAFEADPRLAAAGPRLCLRGKEERIYSDGGILVKDEREGFLKPVHLHRGRTAEEADAAPEARKPTGITTKPDQKADSNQYSPADSRESNSAGSDENSPANNHKNRYKNSKISREIDYVNGSFLVMRVEALREVGLPDERFFLYFEEVDWCMRVKREGWSIAVLKDLAAGQKISDKGENYLYYFSRSWFLFLHKYDRRSIRPLMIRQLKKVKWTMQDSTMPAGKRLSLAWSRLKGIAAGVVNR
ncbi:MAG: hypothetical protein WD317_09295 [Balneolaceae bacterium]